MFESLLIANRGEIACRVIRTARRLGVRTIAVYSDADAGAAHVEAADMAIRIGGPAPRDSYLSIAAVVGAGRRARAAAVHPGYGFLSENAGFAEACAAAGLVFVGPPVAAIRAMGSKSEAKRLMEAAGVPLVPGYHGESQQPDRLAAEAARIGYPVLVKASAGGGGKGMRVVTREADLADAVAGAAREAAAAFGDSRLLVERFLEAPRHVEIQVFADGHGRVVHLFERDCSVQRRHQKVIEEAPAPHLPAATREAMGAAAVRAARAIGYVGAGTVEFLLDRDGRFYFMEMNTRLQVEHPVTEMITGLDLVEWQLAVAAGAPLPSTQDDLAFGGHAIEARLYAEDPARGFVPAPGRVSALALPDDGADPHLRVDSGIREGDTITVHYDPMIAKVVAWGTDRPAALARLRRALARTRVLGPATNLAFLDRILGHPDFIEGGVATDFAVRHETALLAPTEAPDDIALGLAVLALLRRRAAVAEAEAAGSSDPYSPWHATTGWRLNGDDHHVITLRHGETDHAVTVRFRRDGTVLDLPGGARRGAAVLHGDGRLDATLGDVRLVAAVAFEGSRLEIVGDRRWRFEHVDPLASAAAAERPDGHLAAPMPGKVVRVAVAAGDRVVAGRPLIVLEAMKMEHTIRAVADGLVTAVRCTVGDLVEEGAELVVVEPEA